MNNLVLNKNYQLYEQNGKVFCSSLQVAEAFEKRHKHVLDTIRLLSVDVPSDFNGPNFRPVDYLDTSDFTAPNFGVSNYLDTSDFNAPNFGLVDYLDTNDFTESNFGLSNFLDTSGKNNPMYLLSKD